MPELAYETYYLGVRTTRRFLRIPSNWVPTIFFPLIQLIAFSQLYQGIVQLPEFAGETSYLAYLAPGQIAFTAFMAVAWSAYGMIIEYRTGYLDKLRALPIRRWSILGGEMVPLFFQAAAMAGVILIVSMLMGARLATGIGGFLLILALAGIYGIALAGGSFIPALLTRNEQAGSTISMILIFPLIFLSTAFVPEPLLPEWIQVINKWNPITYLIEAIRPLMVWGFDWNAIGAALICAAITGVILQAGTLWAFHRLAR